MAKIQKNDNLQKYRQRQAEINTALVQKAIEHIRKLGGEINFSLVSKVTYDIADATKGEKGLSLAGLSKNKLYRSMIEKAKYANDIDKKSIKHNVQGKISVGDMQMSFHSLRMENAKLKAENKILSKQLQEMEIPRQEIGSIDMRIMKRYETMKNVCASLVSRLLELELVYIDKEKETLNLAIYDETVMQSEALKTIYQKELDGIKN